MALVLVPDSFQPAIAWRRHFDVLSRTLTAFGEVELFGSGSILQRPKTWNGSALLKTSPIKKVGRQTFHRADKSRFRQRAQLVVQRAWPDPGHGSRRWPASLVATHEYEVWRRETTPCGELPKD